MNKEHALRRRWKRLCEDIAEEARRRGAKDPFIFACEHGLCILDGPPFDANENPRNSAEIFTLAPPLVTTISYDAGGW